jgi:NAD(P)-dependent dehydrogenase (short-subunit alcohol dehydrogenase family)
MTRPVAIVTGGRRGIGLAAATALADGGFDLAITDIADPGQDGSPLDALKARGAEALYVHADLADVSSHKNTVDQALSRFGRIDCLVNNAGIGSVVRGDFLELSPENFDAIIDVNLRGTVFFTQAVVRAMLSRPADGPRTIVNITSVSAELSSPERLDYCISKAALSSFTQGLALRLAGEGISVFEVRPGIIRTDMTAKVAARYDALIDSGLVPMKRWGEPGDVGAICAALARGDFGFATGSIINADGGLAIGRL